MTSPVGGKPDSTQDRYDDVFSRGTSFGAELDEPAVRRLLVGQVENPFAAALGDLFDFGTAIITEVADAIGGIFTHDGQRSKPIYDAIIAQMGPVHTQVNTLGQHLQELSTEVTERIDTQEALLEETQGHIDDMSTILDEQKADLAKNQEALDAARQETSEAIEKSGEAVALAKSYNETLNQRITTEFTKATNQATAAVDKATTLAQQLADYKTQAATDIGNALSKAQAANDELAALAPQIDEAMSNSSAAVDTASQTLADYTAWAKTQKTRIDSAVSKAEAATANVSALSPQVAEAVSKSEAATDNVAALTPQVSDAVSQAGAAVDKADAVTSAYNTFKTEQQARIDTAVSKAEKATSDVSTLTPKVTDAVSKAGKASTDVTALTTRVSTAEGRVATAEQNVATLTSKVTDAVTKSDKAVADVATLTPKVTAASNKATQAASDVADLTPKVTAAQEKANKAASDLTTLTPKVTAAQNRADAAYTEAGKVRTDLTPKITAAQTKADTAVADLTKLEPKVTAAQSRADSAYTEAGKVRSEVTPKINAAQTKGQEALSVADKAVDWLKNPVEIGTSIIAIDPETKRPHYANSLELVDDNPPGTSGPTYMSPAEQVTVTTYGPYVAVDPKIKYTVSFWAKASKVGSVIFGQLRTQEGRTVTPDGKPPFKGGVTVANPPQPSNKDSDGNYVHAVGNSSYFVTGLKLNTTWTYYETEIQFNEGITAVSIMRMFWSHPDGVPANQYISGLDIRPQIPTQASVDKAQNDAIRANTDILRQQQEINAAQATANLAQKNFNDNQQKWNTASGNATKALQDSAALQGLLNDAQADINAHQKIFNDNQTKWNTASTNATKALADAAKAQTAINAEQTKFNNFQTQFNKDQIAWNKASTDATKAVQDSTSALSKIATEQSKLNSLQSDFNTKQIAWNSAVDRSLTTQKKVNDNFDKWTEAATKAVEANTTAIKALTKPEIGSSLIALDPDTREPHYLQWAGSPRTPSTTGLPFTKAVRVDSSEQVRNDAPAGMKVPVKVNPDIVYKWSVWVYSNKVGTEIAFLTTSDSIGLCVEKTTYKQDGKDDRVYTSKWGIFPKDIPTGWSKHEGTIKFLPGTDNVHLYAVEWNKTNVASAQQWFGGFDIVPDVPTQEQVDAAQNTALEAHDLLFKKQDDWNEGTTAALIAQKKVDDNFQKWTDGAAKAIEANTTALAIINAGKQGSNIIPVNPVSERPWFAEPLKESTDHPPGTSGPTYYSPAAQTSVTTYGPYVEVDPKIKYTVSFWAKASKAGSFIYGQFRSQEGRTVAPNGGSITKGAVTVANPPQPSNKNSDGKYVHSLDNNSYFVSNLKLNTTWTYYETEIQFNEGITAVSIMRMYWSHTNGVAADQYISGLSIRPQIPTQAQVDDAQNKAIESLGILTKKQGEWSAGAQKAITATTDVATALARINGIQVGGRNLLKKSNLNISNKSYPITRADFGDSVPADGEEITISVKGSLGAGKESIAFYNSGGSTFIGKVLASERDSNGVYKVTTKWKSNSANTHVNIYAMPNSVTTASTVEWIKLERGNQASDWTPAPEDLPTQKQVDDTQTTAIRANTDAIKALGKKSLGASLVPYKTPSDQEVEDYAAGKLSYDPWADPEYFDAGYSIASNTTYGRYTRANASQGSKSIKATYVSVDSSIEYRIKFDAYADAAGSILVVAMQDQNGSTAVQSTSVRDAGTMGNTSYPIHYLTLKKGWSTYSGKIKFKPTTTAARFSTFYWNHTNGVSTTQCLTNLEIVPDVPTQDDLNLSFSNNFSKIDGELKLVKESDKSFRDKQTKWNQASTDASNSLKEFDKQQTEINKLVQEQLWSQLDMIEQLDIQTPRVFHRRTTEGNLEKAPDWTTWTDCRYHDSPFILHLTRFQDTRKMYWVAKGRWEGKLKVTTNWTNGATDVMVYEITRDEANHMAYREDSTKLAKKARAYAEEGGAAFKADLRNSTFEIYPTHLGRTVGIRNPDSSGWYIDQSVMETGGPSMVRHQTKDEIRFTNSFYSTLAFYGRDKKGNKILVNANQVVEPMMIRRADLRVGTTYTFHEKPFVTNTW